MGDGRRLDEVGVTSPFANARADARSSTAEERLEASASTRRPATASIAGGPGRQDGVAELEGDLCGGPGPEDRAVRPDLDDAGVASAAPNDAMSAADGRRTAREGSRIAADRGLPAGAVRAAEIAAGAVVAAGIAALVCFRAG